MPIGIVIGVLRVLCVFVIIGEANIVLSWLPDPAAKIILKKGDEHVSQFAANENEKQHFCFLDRDDNSIVIGARNAVYFLYAKNLKEIKNKRIEWNSSTANQELCILKGKSFDDCQNYIRIFAKLANGNYLVCGTNSFKPLCRTYSYSNNKYAVEQEDQKKGVCPFDPEFNSTSVYYDGQLYSGTVSTFSGDDPLIFREPTRTEQYDFKKLNAPDFVHSFAFDDYVFFFFREAAVEYMNAGKAIFSRVARVCKNDKGNHIKNDTWTSFLKARLNCSIPGEYPFYFDEIQSVTDVVHVSGARKLIFAAFTTSPNAIGGSAVCAFDLDDILRVFRGSFKYQEKFDSNWLPVPEKLVPKTRPGQCVRDSRLLPDDTVEFIKDRFFMDGAVPMFAKQPLLKSVSLQFRYSAIAVEPQVSDIYNNNYNILYIGTNDGKIIKAVNFIHQNGEVDTVQIWQNQILALGVTVRGLKVDKPNMKLVVISDNEILLKDINHCSIMKTCWDCVALRDPYCAWNDEVEQCIELKQYFVNSDLKQDVRNDRKSICSIVLSHQQAKNQTDISNDVTSDNNLSSLNAIQADDLSSNKVDGKIVLSAGFTSFYSMILIVIVSMLLLGFCIGFFAAKRFQIHSKYLETPFIEQHNQLNRLTNTSIHSNTSNLMGAQKSTKTVNLDVNIPNVALSKGDNFDMANNVNIVVNDGTLQKTKKTYI